MSKAIKTLAALAAVLTISATAHAGAVPGPQEANESVLANGTDVYTITGIVLAAGVAAVWWALGSHDPADDPVSATVLAVRRLHPSTLARRLHYAWTRIGADHAKPAPSENKQPVAVR